MFYAKNKNKYIMVLLLKVHVVYIYLHLVFEYITLTDILLDSVQFIMSWSNTFRRIKLW